MSQLYKEPLGGRRLIVVILAVVLAFIIGGCFVGVALAGKVDGLLSIELPLD